MLMAIKHHIWIVLVSAGISAAAFAIAHATIPDGDGVIHGCYRNSDGNLRVVNDPTSCRHDETALSWNQTGPQGPPGPIGAPGPQGPQGVPGTSASSHAYEASNTHELPEDTYLVGLTLPPGEYVVWSTIDFYEDNNGNANTQCAIWTGSEANPQQHFHYSAGEDTAIFSGNNRNDQYFATLMAAVVLTASENQVLVYCYPGGGKGYANGQIIATAVDAFD
ncbi:MAG: hypothetical protein WAK55_15775 [Xanthobacteraceae bacterium]